MYSRVQGDNLDAFLTQCHLYFFLNEDKFEEDEKKTTFMVSYMRGTAYAQFEERLGAYLADPSGAPLETRRLFAQLATFEAELRLVFGSVDKKRLAERELHALKQRTSAKDYAANFQRLTAGLGWNDDALASQFHAGLKTEVRIAILRKETQPANLNELICMAIKEDDLIYQMHLEKKGQAPKKTFNKPNQGQSRNSSNYYGPKPMELDALQKKPKERKSHKGGKASTRKGKCYNCGKEGHFANKCRQPKKQPHDGQAVRSMQPVTTSTGKPAVAGVLKQVQPVTAQLAMMNIISKNGHVFKYGPNQPVRDVRNAEITIEKFPEAALDYKHSLHQYLPMSECRDGECRLYTWEHRNQDDHGNPDWVFSGDETRCHNTLIRRTLENEDCCKDPDNILHHRIPMSCCLAVDCDTHHKEDGAFTHPNMLQKRFFATKTTQPSGKKDKLPSMRKVLPRTESEESLKTPKPLRWAKKPNLDSSEIRHRDLDNEQCRRPLCLWHGKGGLDSDMAEPLQPMKPTKLQQRKPTPVPPIHESLRSSFTPVDTDSELELDKTDLYIEALCTAVQDLMFVADTENQCRLEMRIPSERFDVAMKIRCNPDKMDPKERFSMLIKAYAKEPETESETEEEDGDTSDVEIIHGAQSENEQDLWA